MMYHYVTLSDETEITYSHLIEKDGAKILEVHFERPTNEGFDIARCQLPTFEWLRSEGFSNVEIGNFEQYLRDNLQLLYKSADNKCKNPELILGNNINEKINYTEEFDNELDETCGIPDDEITRLFQEGVQHMKEDKKKRGLPICNYDYDKNSPYIEYPDGRREYPEEL